MQPAIKHNWFFPQPAETIWEFLTTPELLAQWLMPNDFKPETGQYFMFRTGPHPALNFDGNIYCQVLEIVPQKKLSYTWKYGPGKGITTVDSLVTWTLQPKNGGTELFLLHTGFDESINIMDYQAMNTGWQTNVNKIEKLLSIK